MKRFLIVSILALVVPAAALAKGASEATIEGPGFDGLVVIPGDGEGGGTPLGRIAELAGFFPAVFERVPNPMLEQQPDVQLGSRYTIRYVMPGPGGVESVIEQQLYPYATPSPVSYTEPGQLFWDGQRTFGGWYPTTVELKQALETVGLPATAPSTGDDGFWSSTPRLIGTFGGIAAIAFAAAGLVLVIRRRRLHPAATH